MVDIPAMEKFDPSGMYKVYDRWPEIADGAYSSKILPASFDGIDHVIFAGMGGSGTVGDLFSSILSRTGIHVTVVKGYLLPRTVNRRTLVVCTSVSGDTAETMAVAKSARDLGCKLICFSSGGRLEQFCAKNSVEFRRVPAFLNPRSSFPSYVYSMAKVLSAILPIRDADVTESLQRIKETRARICSSNMETSNPSLELARWMNGMPLVYYPWGLQAVAIRFKNSVQENMKSHAMTEDIIEASHNGIVSWERRTQVVPVIISGEDDHAMTVKRWHILREFFAKMNIDYREVRSSSGSILSKIMGLIYQLDFTTIYGAVLRGIDPCPVPSIDFVKGRT